MNSVISPSEVDITLNGAEFPELLEEFKGRCIVNWSKDSFEVKFPWPVCVDSIDDPGRVYIQLYPSLSWDRFRQLGNDVRQGVSPDFPMISAAIRIYGVNKGSISIVLDSEVFSVKSFSDQWGLELDKLIVGDSMYQRFQGYRLINAGCDGEVSAVAISRPNGQFGNNFKQLVHAVQLCRRIGIKKVYIPKLSQFALPESGGRIHDIEFFSYEKCTEIHEKALLGTYFYKDSFGDFLGLDSVQQQDIVDNYIRHLFAPLREIQSYPKNQIVIHIRSNDLFNRPKPHPRYPQPPLAFYQLVLDHFRQIHPDMSVALVYQDKENPVISELERYLSKEGIPFSVYSASLVEDLRILLAHETVVFGRGTFGKAIVSLSQNIKRVYFPWTDMDFRFILRTRKLSGYVVKENSPQYIAIGEWRNTADQRRLMVEYPVENLNLYSYDARV